MSKLNTSIPESQTSPQYPQQYAQQYAPQQYYPPQYPPPPPTQPSLTQQMYNDLKGSVPEIIEPVSTFGKMYSVYSLIITAIIVIVVIYFSIKLINYNSTYLSVTGTVMQDSICTSSTVTQNNVTRTVLSCQTLIKFKPNNSGGMTGSSNLNQPIIYQQIYNPIDGNSNNMRSLSNQGGFIDVGYDNTTGEYNQIFDTSSTSYIKGDKVTVYYKADSVSTSATLGIIPNTVAWIVMGIALLILISSIFWTYASFKNKAISTAEGGAAIYGLFKK